MGGRDARLSAAAGGAVVRGGRTAALSPLGAVSLVFPDGSSISLDDVPAADLAGYAGLGDEVDVHTWRLLNGIALSTLLGVGTEVGLGSGESELVRALREATQQNAARAGDRIVARDLEVSPTITVRPGWPLRAIVHEDLVLRPWKG